MTTYYDYLRHRVETTPVSSQAQLEHLIEAERNAAWQRIASNPLYDEPSRMAALAAFDEAAAHILSERTAWQTQGLRADQNGVTRAAQHAEPNARFDPGQRIDPSPHVEPRARPRSALRAILYVLLGAALGFAAGYLSKDSIAPMLSSVPADETPEVLGLTAEQKSFKFVRSGPSALEGELKVDFAPGANTADYTCKVEATYRQILEYVRFDEACKAVTFKFLPLTELWKNFNYLEGYVVFTAGITSSAGGQWEGSTSVYFSINGTT